MALTPIQDYWGKQRNRECPLPAYIDILHEGRREDNLRWTVGQVPSQPRRGSRRARCTTTCSRMWFSHQYLLSMEREENALVLDGDYYMACSGGSKLNEICRIQKWPAEDKSGNQPLPKDYNHGNAARVCKTGSSVRSGDRQAVGWAVRTRKLSAANRGAGRACQNPRL
ncbi:hypothetical protein QTP88_002404 [Uroleucon formosanum]